MSAVMNPVESSELSLLKQRLLSRYARGEISRVELADEAEKIQPPKVHLSIGKSLLIVIATLLSVALIPPWVRREES